MQVSNATVSPQLCELPSHLWCWLARHGDISDFGAVLCCSATLFSKAEAYAMWHYHAFTSGYARPAVRPGLDWIYPFMPEMLTDHCIDWQKFLCMNSETRNLPSIWVRIRDVDVRMPLPPASVQNPVAVVLAELDRLTHFRRDHAASSSSSSSSPGVPESHLRLRLLQWAGRPGPVLQGTVMAGDHLLLEWVPTWDDRWPLPPHTVTAAASNPSPPKARSTNLFTGASLFNAWRRGFESQVPSSAPTATDSSQGRQVLVRVTAVVSRGVPPIIHGELWLLLDLTSATLRCLYDSLADLLKRESPCKEKLPERLEFQLMDSQVPTKKAVYPETRLLRKLCWTHCEALSLEWTPDAGQSHLIYIRREQELIAMDIRPPGADGVSVPKEEKEKTAGTGNATEMPQLAPTLPNAAEQPNAMRRPQTWWEADEASGTHSRSSSQCPRPAALSPSSRGVPVDDAECERAHSPGSSRMRPGQDLEQFSRSARGSAAVARHPGDTAVESEGEPGGSSVGEAANGVWERLAPHYQPKLLVNTHQTRQFEFHPSLPQVLLTGDKRGGVNVIHTEEEELRRPLIVDSCPVLGLAWMRHHPQSAVCGAAHSGQIRFLKYDLQANPQDPALQHVLTVDEFPKLSSLSINCTDDFLLASGFTHDLALYDTGTGQVLHRVLGVHSHFINISRFAHRCPHVFATASFDHTCKVWDLRQPLIHDRPVKVLHTGGLNVMCTFSPDDRYLLCSGIDTRITQFELPSFKMFPDSFPLRPAMHQARYRRSMYFATGRHFVTAATDESHIRIMSASGKNMGVVDFCGLLGRTWTSLQRPLPGNEKRRKVGMPRRSRMMDGFECKLQRAEGREEPRVMWEAGALTQGEVQLDDELARMRGASAAEGRTHKEYVQSVRTHPIVENRVGVLLSSYHPDPQSYIAFVHLDPNYSEDD